MEIHMEVEEEKKKEVTSWHKTFSVSNTEKDIIVFTDL